MATIYYDNDADLKELAGQPRRDHRLRQPGPRARAEPADSGVDVVVGLPADSRSRAKAEAEGLTVLDAGRGRRAGRHRHDPHPRHRPGRQLYREEIAPHLRPGKTLMFAHGFNIRFGTIEAPPGRRRLDDRAQGAGPPRARGLQGRSGHAGLLAVHQDASGSAQAARPSPTPRASAAPARASSRPPSPRRPRPTSSASRPCCAAASRPW